MNRLLQECISPIFFFIFVNWNEFFFSMLLVAVIVLLFILSIFNFAILQIAKMCSKRERDNFLIQFFYMCLCSISLNRSGVLFLFFIYQPIDRYYFYYKIYVALILISVFSIINNKSGIHLSCERLRTFIKFIVLWPLVQHLFWLADSWRQFLRLLSCYSTLVCFVVFCCFFFLFTLLLLIFALRILDHKHTFWDKF